MGNDTLTQLLNQYFGRNMNTGFNSTGSNYMFPSTFSVNPASTAVDTSTINNMVNQPVNVDWQNSAYNSFNGTFPQYDFNSSLGSTYQDISNINQPTSNIPPQSQPWTGRDTLGAVQTGFNVLSGLYNMWAQNQALKLAKRAQEEKIALQRANYTNTAKAMNAQYRDQMSGRGTSVMSGGAKRQLGRMYANRKVNETY